jgi:hypothetical protein
MAYFIFLKSLRSLEEFRKNPHVKIPSKSPCANFQSHGIFKNQILFGKEFFASLLAHPAIWPSRGPFLFSSFQPAAPPLPTGPWPHGRPSRPSHRWRPAELPPPPQEDASSRAAFALSSRLANRWTPPVIPHLRPARARPRRHHLPLLPAPPSPTSDATPPLFPPP